MDEFKDSKSVLVGDVDCTAEGKSLCEKYSIGGYPTIKGGDPAAMEDYNGGRTLEDFQKYAGGLGPQCSPDNLDACDDASKAEIEKYQKMDPVELDKLVAEAEDSIAKIEAKHKKIEDTKMKEIEDLQKDIESEKKKKEAAVAKEDTKLGLRIKRKVVAKKNKADSGKKAKKGKGSKKDEM